VAYIPEPFEEMEEGRYLCPFCRYFVKQGEPFEHEPVCSFLLASTERKNGQMATEMTPDELRETVVSQAVKMAHLQQSLDHTFDAYNRMSELYDKRADEVRSLSGSLSACADLLRSQIERIEATGNSSTTRASVIQALWYLFHGMHKTSNSTEFKLRPTAPEGQEEKAARLDRRKPPFWPDPDSSEEFEDLPGPAYFTGDWVDRAYAFQEERGWLLPQGRRDALIYSR